jgi:hypothetical protein|tara:strand:+ start:412 stop:921 length:510 start_codon:yes stop_codon:yes gene_type:complete
MSISLYDATVGSFQQNLGGMSGFLDKGRNHYTEHSLDLSEVLETRIFDDMLPFSYQVIAAVHHSLGAINAARNGVFSPPQSDPDCSYEDLQNLVKHAVSELAKVTREEINGFEGKNLEFKAGSYSKSHVADVFLATLSVPNCYFHTTTAYNILRMKGVPVGKGDFLNRT